MKKFIFLFIVIELACATQAFAKNVRNEAVNGDSRKIVTFTESSIAENNVVASDRILALDTSMNSGLAENRNGMSIPASDKHDESDNTPLNQATINSSKSVDMSEPSSIILLGVGAVIAIVAKWRKSINLSLQSNKTTPLTTITRTSGTMRTERRKRKTERISASFNS